LAKPSPEGSDSSRLHHRLARPPSPAPLFEVENLLILESKLLSKSTLGQPFFSAFRSMQFLLVLIHILFPQVGVVPTANRCRSLREYSLLEFCDSISTSLPLILFLPGANTSDPPILPMTPQRQTSPRSTCDYYYYFDPLYPLHTSGETRLYEAEDMGRRSRRRDRYAMAVMRRSIRGSSEHEKSQLTGSAGMVQKGPKGIWSAANSGL